MNKSTIIGLVAAATVASASLFGGIALAAGTASFTVSGGGTVTSGNTITVNVSENSADAVNTVTANLSYDTSKLQLVGVAAGSTFGQGFSSNGSGSVSITRYTDPGSPAVVGNAQIATVSFKALVGAGSATVNTVDSSKIASNGTDVWNHVVAGTTIVFSAPVQGGMGSGSGGSSTGDTGTTTTTTSGHNTAVAQNTTTSTPAATNTPATDAKTDTKAQTKGDTTKNSDNKKEMVQSTATKKHSVWPWIILVVVAGAAIAYALRNRGTTPASDQEADAKVVKPVADDGKAAATIAAATAAARNEAKPAANKNTRNKRTGHKKTGKKNR